MIPNLLWQPDAERDYIEIVEYLTLQAGQDTAQRFIDVLDGAIQRIQALPQIGSRRPSQNPNLAELRFSVLHPFKEYMLFYRPDETELIIVRIIHAKRDYQRLI